MNRTCWGFLFVGLASWMGVGVATSCSSSDQALGEGRVEHPDPAPPPPNNTALPSAQASLTPAPTQHPAPLAVADDPCSGPSRPPLDKAIAEDEPARPWSKNVPTRSCTNDSECGDGYCDRGRCAAIWTSTLQYGQRCERNCPRYGSLPCIDGRYRSCISDKECEWASHIQDAKCAPDSWAPGFRSCDGVVPSIKGTAVPGPPPQRPRQ